MGRVWPLWDITSCVNQIINLFENDLAEVGLADLYADSDDKNYPKK
jgi:hypothetical protein